MLRVIIVLILISLQSLAVDYHVGPSQILTSISQVPWASLEAGDKVYIHWRESPYKEKWVINRQGTQQNRIEIIGISGPQGQQAVIDGDGATTVAGVNFWNEARGVIKIGGSNIPTDGLPSYITIENLEIRSGRPPFQFSNDNNQIESYSNNAAAIYVEKAQHLIIRNCTLRDSGNGLFIGTNGGQTQDILIEKNHIYENGNVGRIFEHNSYTEATNITYQFNHFGPLRTGALGNNLKDRSAGLVVRYNWIESGNRQLDLVDAEGSTVLVNDPRYRETHVYANILIEPDAAGNSQIVHYGGDSGTVNEYRKGDLYFYNNTIVSTRLGNTTLIRLSTNDETAHVFNNIIFNTASGSNMAMIDGSGTFNMNNNWLKPNWVDCHCSPTGSVINLGNQIEGSNPNFVDFANQDFHLQDTSATINQAAALPAHLLSNHNILFEYKKHLELQTRVNDSQLDMGAYEFCDPITCDLIFIHGFD
jgi:hypothetical protein